MKHALATFIAFIVLVCSPVFVQAASFSISPSSGSVGASCSGKVNIMINAGGEPVNAANVQVFFDPGQVGSVQLLPGSYFESYVDNVVSGNQARLTGFSVSSTPSGSGFFAQLRYRALTAGPANFSINFTGPGVSTDSNIASAATSDDLLTSVSGASITITNDPCPVAPPPTPAAPASTPDPTVSTCESLGCTADLICSEDSVGGGSSAATEPVDCSLFAGQTLFTMPIPHSTVETSRLQEGHEVIFRAFEKRSVLPRVEDVVTSVEGLEMFVTVPWNLFLETPREMQILFAETQHVAVSMEEQEQFDATLRAPDRPGMYSAALVYFFEDDRREVLPFYLEVLPMGMIHGVLDQDKKEDQHILVTVYQNGEVWDASGAGQANPQLISTTSRTYTALVPDGEYQVEARLPGYQTYYTDPVMTSGFLQQGLWLKPSPYRHDLLSEQRDWGGFVLGSFEQMSKSPHVRPVMTKLSWMLLFVAALLAGILWPYHAQYMHLLWHRPRAKKRGAGLQEVAGLVYNESTKKPIPGVLFCVKSKGSTRTKWWFKDRRDGYLLGLLPKGSYEGLVSALGYHSWEFPLEIKAAAGMYAPKGSLKPKRLTRLATEYLHGTLWFVVWCVLVLGFLLSLWMAAVNGLVWIAVGLIYLYLNHLIHHLIKRY